MALVPYVSAAGLAVGYTPAQMITGGAVVGAMVGVNVEVLANVGTTTIVRLTKVALAALSALNTVAAEVAAEVASVASNASSVGSLSTTTYHTVRSCQSAAAVGEGVVGVSGGVVGGLVGARAGQVAVESGAKVLSTVGKVVGTAGGALGFITGGAEMGLAINALVNGSPTQNEVIEFKDALKAVKPGRLNAKQLDAFNCALRDTEILLEDVTHYVKAVNGTKVGGGAVSAIGGGLLVAGIFFPPFLIPGLITTAVGATTSITTMIIELTSDHKDRLIKIMEKLKPSGLYDIVENNLAALKKYQVEHKTKGEGLEKCQAELKKLRRKSQGSKNPSKYGEKEMQIPVALEVTVKSPIDALIDIFSDFARFQKQGK